LLAELTFSPFSPNRTPENGIQFQLKNAEIAHPIKHKTHQVPINKTSAVKTRRIRTFFSLLCDQFSLKINPAKKFEGFITRVMSKLAAFSILQRINIEKNRPLNQIKHAWRNRHNGLLIYHAFGFLNRSRACVKRNFQGNDGRVRMREAIVIGAQKEAPPMRTLVSGHV
jgi:hypothetical protein